MSLERAANYKNKLQGLLPGELFDALNKADGATRLIHALPALYPPAAVVKSSREYEAFAGVGLYYHHREQNFEALAILSRLYDHFLSAQEQMDNRFHKGAVLVWISDAYRALGFATLWWRFLMLTLVEDAIQNKGVLPVNDVGVYWRLIQAGMPDARLHDYVRKAYERYMEDPAQGRFPEWILQDLDKEWIIQIPTSLEAGFFVANTSYIRHLIKQMDDGTGRALERLADYLMSCMPGCRTARRQATQSSDFDVVCSIEGFDRDFRSELGRYFACECKDWKTPADFTTMAKFCRVLDSIKAKFGILFSREGISGKKSTKNAAREQLKVYQDRGIVIVVVDRADLDALGKGGNLISILRGKYERVRLDLQN